MGSPPLCWSELGGLEERSRCRGNGLPRIQHGLLDVIEPDGELGRSHPHPGKTMRGPPKALLRVPNPERGELRPSCPFDDP